MNRCKKIVTGVALEGYLLHNMKWYERVMSVAGGLLLIYPGIVTDVIGLVLLVQILTKKKSSAAAL